MKRTIKTLLVMMLVAVMLASSVSAYAASKPAAATDTVTELNWTDFEDALKESELEGDFYALNAVAVQFWVPSIFEQKELTDEDAEQGLIAYFDDGDGDYGFFVTYVDGQGITLEEYAKEVEDDEDYTDLEYLTINGLDAISYSEHDKEMEMDFQYVSFITDGGYVLTFTFWDTADEDYMALVAIMAASIMPEETESK